MSSCSRNRKRLNVYIDGELPEQARHSVARHLADCESCRTVLDGLRGLEPYLQTLLDTPPIPAALASRILSEASLRRRKVSENRNSWWWRAIWPQPWFVTGATTAALVIGLAMGAWMGWTSYRDAGSGQLIAGPTQTDGTASSLYAFDVLSAEPHGSLEAASLAFLENGR
jgi:anti-sigma factor RsiW